MFAMREQAAALCHPRTDGCSGVVCAPDDELGAEPDTDPCLLGMNPPTVFRSRSRSEISCISLSLPGLENSPLVLMVTALARSGTVKNCTYNCVAFKEPTAGGFREEIQFALSLFILFYFIFLNAVLPAATRPSYRSLGVCRTGVYCRNLPTCKAAASIQIPKRCIFLFERFYIPSPGT